MLLMTLRVTAEVVAERIKEGESSKRISRVLWAQLGRE